MKEYEQWLAKAKEDFETARYNLQGSKWEAGIFFLHQAAEKALKSLYIKKQKELIKTHDLVLLARKVRAPKEIIERCKHLTPTYQYTRYPDVVKAEDLEKEAETFLTDAREVLAWVQKEI